MPTDSPPNAPEPRHTTHALVEAAKAAGHAPSIHNTQPWRWRLSGDALDLYLEHSRLLGITDPDTRLAVLSCAPRLPVDQVIERSEA